MSFPLFTSFPAEVQNLIMEQCPPNDRVCLRLTCKFLFTLSTPQRQIDLESTDLGSSHLCGDWSNTSYWNSSWLHLQQCHKLSYQATCERNESLGRSTPEMKKTCRTRWLSDHCECYTSRMKLHLRLKSWMPKGLKYCGACRKFTRRKRGHNGRCYHGKPKERKATPNYWTHRSRGGAFGYKVWKKWFNNRAMNSFERRLASERAAVERNGSERYALRTLELMDVDTKEARGSKIF